MLVLTPETYERRFWLKSYDNDTRPTLSYPRYPAPELLHMAAVLDPDKVAVDFCGTEITFSELYSYSNRLANGLIEAGIKKGDRIGLMLPNSPQLVMAFWALLETGAIILNLNPMYTAEELEAMASKTGMTGMITFSEAVSTVKKLDKMIDLPFVMVTKISDFIDGMGTSTPEELGLQEGWHHFSQFLGHNTNDVAPIIPINPEEDAAVLQFTGGTTGTPKAATLTHYNLVVATHCVSEWGRCIINTVPVSRRAIVGILPYFHVFGEICCNALSMLTRSTQIILPRFDVDELMTALDRFSEVWYFPLVPTMLTAILNHPRGAEIGRKFKVVNPGAAPCTVELLQKAREMKWHIVQGWGMSESTSLGMTQPFLGVKKPLCIGLPYPDTDIRIVDTTTGETVAPGTPGEIWMKSPLVMKGYWNDPEETAKQLTDGWLHTGDIAYQDEDGYVFIVDRSKDLIIAGGYNIYPQEVDNALFKHPQIVDVITIGIPDEYRGETVKAFVQLAAGAAVTEAELIDFCREHLAAYKVPRSIEFRDVLPRSAVGKALRRVLRDEEIARIKKTK